MVRRPVTSGPEPVTFVDPPIRVHSAVEKSPKVDDLGLSGDERLLEQARKQYRSVCRGEYRLRRDMLDDKRFRLAHIGDQKYQFPDGVAMERRADKRPVLQVNRVAGFVDMARSDGDNANLRIKVNPVDDKGDPDVANVLAGMIRNVETRSQAEDVYSTAGDNQCENGRGYIWLLMEFENDDTFRQRARLMRILNPFRVKVDTSAQEKDQSDAEFAFYETDVDEDTWDALYGGNGRKERPSRDAVQWGDNAGELTGDWFPSEGKIRVMHWFCAEYESDTLYEFADGQTMRGKAIKEAVQEIADLYAAKALELGEELEFDDRAMKDGFDRYVETMHGGMVRKREIRPRTMKWRIIDAKYVHQETTWHSPWQPFIPMVGAENDLEGDRDTRGVTRDVKDSQRIYNVEVSAQVEAVNDMPKAPWIGPKGAFGKPNTPMNNAWKAANTKRFAYLEYEVVDIDGKSDPRPTRTFAEPAIQGINQAIQQADLDMKATARIHNASLGEGPADKSGRAILERQRQDELANSYFTRNRRSCLASAGKHLIQLFRTAYDVATVLRIVGADETKELVMVYSGEENDPRNEANLEIDPETGERVPFTLPSGVKDVFDIGTGDYDVEVSAGPHPGSRRQEDSEFAVKLLDILARMSPPHAAASIDLMVGLMDSPIARQLEARFKKMLPPMFREQKDSDGQPVNIPPEILEKLQTLEEQNKTLAEALTKASEDIRTKRLELASKEQIAALTQYVELVKAIMAEDNVDRRLMLQTETDRIYKFLEMSVQRQALAEEKAEGIEGLAATASAAVGPGRPSAGAPA